jgi:uncharacterized membrane protein
MRTKMLFGFIALLSATAMAAVALNWGSLPARIPVHWNVRGQIDGWGPRWLLWIFSILPALMGGLLWILPRFDPKRVNYARHETAFQVTMGVLAVIMASVFWMTFASSLGHPVRVGFILPLILGLGFILMGNFLPQVKFNYTFGVRTPWTLSNEEVWRRTHRIAGAVFIAMGLGAIVAAFFEGKAISALFLAGPMILGIVFLFVFSWWIHRKARGG